MNSQIKLDSSISNNEFLVHIIKDDKIAETIQRYPIGEEFELDIYPTPQSVTSRKAKIFIIHDDWRTEFIVNGDTHNPKPLHWLGRPSFVKEIYSQYWTLINSSHGNK